MSLFTVQTIQKFRYAVEDALWAPVNFSYIPNQSKISKFYTKDLVANHNVT